MAIFLPLVLLGGRSHKGNNYGLVCGALHEHICQLIILMTVGLGTALFKMSYVLLLVMSDVLSSTSYLVMFDDLSLSHSCHRVKLTFFFLSVTAQHGILYCLASFVFKL